MQHTGATTAPTGSSFDMHDSPASPSQYLVSLLLQIPTEQAIAFLSAHAALDENALAQFEPHWDWSAVSGNPHVRLSMDCVDRFARHWDWKRLFINPHTGVHQALAGSYLHAFAAQIQPHTHSLDYDDPRNFWTWNRLSSSESLPWSMDFIEAFKDHWNFRALTRNASLPWSEALLERFAAQWDWHVLSRHCPVPLTPEVLARFEHHWDWNSLSCNTKLPWCTTLIKRFEREWDWPALSCNPAIPWSEELLQRFADASLPQIGSMLAHNMRHLAQPHDTAGKAPTPPIDPAL